MNLMHETTLLACKAYTKGEVPVGAIIERNGKIISKTINSREKDQIATHHAEIKAIEKACKKLKSWRLDDCTLYVNLEPCPMCAGAILNARIPRVVYAVKDDTSGGFSKFNLLSALNHTTTLTQDKTYEQENKTLLQNFFKEKRKKK